MLDPILIRKGSLKRKVIIQVTLQVIIALLLMIVVMVIFVNDQLSLQMNSLLKFEAQELNDKVERRLKNLVENTSLLTTNELMINALTDSEGRDKYLSPLVNNYIQGKDVVSLSIVDFDGMPIFQTQTKIPLYNESPQLRTALALNKSTLYINELNGLLTLVNPIEYYSTTQGAVIVEFNLLTILKSLVQKNSSTYVRLIGNDRINFSHNYRQGVDYQKSQYIPAEDMPNFQRLQLGVEIGLPRNEFNEPIKYAILKMLLLGVILIIISLFFATNTANKITQPILELSRRVKSSSQQKEILCSPLGCDDELEELAKAFDERTLKLQYQAKHDSLTNLPNRLLFLDRLRQAIKTAKRDKSKLAVLFVDLDRFKEVNDSYGHETGDELLQQVAQKIKQLIRSSDSIARLGGDEFSILLDAIKNEDFIVTVLEKLMNTFKQPIILKRNKFYITSSIGVSVYPYNGETPEDLIRNADAAMYRAKDEGRNTFEFYTHDMTEKAFERVTLENQLRQAIINREFVVYYQPQIEITTQHIIGMEALVRWQHPQEGLISPFRFLPLAEETGMIVEIDRMVMQMAMQQFHEWELSGLMPGVLSMNLSMIQLNQQDFLDAVKVNIFDSLILPEKIIFEVTETQVMRNPEASLITLEQLKELGVKLAIDDFGTGHSSLSYLKKLPVDKIKIDQSFIRDIPEDKEDMELTIAIISLAKSLKIGLIAEGVETQEQVDFLINNACHEAQGYLFGRPMDVQAAGQLLADKKPPQVAPISIAKKQK